MAKANLTWGKANAVARSDNIHRTVNVLPISRSADSHVVDSAVKPSTNSGIDYIAWLGQSLDPDGLAIAVICGAEDWGMCAKFDTRWKDAQRQTLQ